MSRWHASSCYDPRIVVEQQRPRCETCNSSPEIDALVAAEESKPSSIPYLPPDEQPGQMQLWWPPCVPYATTGPDGHPVTVEPPENHLQGQFTDEVESSEELDRLYIYPQRLKEDEFRVLCLTPVDDANDPIHVSLEVYDDRYYPEYETVSYTWGGEDGDSSLCQSVYIGPYWDVLLQTRNCWEMLRYLRPWKGVRTLWVDAICINQTDIRERQKQVAKMGQIYEKATRLVIYLGPDLVPPTSTSSPYPRRHHLRELDTLTGQPQLPSKSSIFPKQWSLSDVLSREYFRRLWIIQELVMSRNITLRIGDTEFIIDESVGSQAAQASDVPWFTFVTRRLIGDPSGNSLRAAVELADSSRASDPRDKIYGVLGLVDVGDHYIAAAYSISFRHLAIGYYAYCLLAKKDLCVLIHASGLRAPEGMPSWAPLAQYDASNNKTIIPRTTNRKFDWLYMSGDFLEAYSKHHLASWFQPCPTSTEDAYTMDSKYSGLNEHHCFELTCEWTPRGRRLSLSQPCWYSDATIDNSTGGINLTAMHVLSFNDIDLSKAEIERNGEVYVHTLKAGTSTLYMYADKCILDLAHERDKTHLFVLCDNADDSIETWTALPNPYRDFVRPKATTAKSRICVLQQVNHESKFRLLSASVIACFHVPRMVNITSNPFLNANADFIKELDCYRFSSFICVAYDDRLNMPLPLIRYNVPPARARYKGQLSEAVQSRLDIHGWRVSQRVDELQKLWVEPEGEPESCEYYFRVRACHYARFPSPRLAFPRVNKSSILLEVFKSILDAEKSGSSVEFFNIYFEAVQEFDPKLIQWRNRRRNTANDLSREQVDIIQLVQLRFKPNQYEVLENILNSIQEDVKRGIEDRGTGNLPHDAFHGPFHPPFLRFGWRDLATNQTDDVVEKADVDDGDIHGFYALDGINEVVNRFRDELYHDIMFADYEERRRRMDEWLHTNGSLIDSSGKRIYDDSIVRDHAWQTTWVAFDLLSLTLWAQTHPCMVGLRGLPRSARALRPLQEEKKGLMYLDWLPSLMEDFKIDGELRPITII